MNNKSRRDKREKNEGNLFDKIFVNFDTVVEKLIKFVNLIKLTIKLKFDQ